jgi:CheY-like chemotaxis protein
MNKHTILIVDDCEIQLDLLKCFLRTPKGFFKTISASNGQEAIEMAVKHKPELILMDWDMPGINGLQAINELKTKESTKEIPIIMATGVMLSPTELQIAYKHGAVDYIRKPFEQKELISRIHFALSQTENFRKLKFDANENQILRDLTREKDHQIGLQHRENEMLVNQILHNTTNMADILNSLEGLIHGISEGYDKIKIERSLEMLKMLRQVTQDALNNISLKN